MVKRLKKRPSTSSSIFDFYGHGETNTPLAKALMTNEGRDKANNLLKDEAAGRLNNTFGVEKKVVKK
jgi:hypothetical protein